MHAAGCGAGHPGSRGGMADLWQRSGELALLAAHRDHQRQCGRASRWRGRIAPGDVSDGKGTWNGQKVWAKSTFEATPLMTDGTLYIATPFNRIIALDPETGKEKWTFDPKLNRIGYYGDDFTCRGLAMSDRSPTPTGTRPAGRRFMKPRWTAA